MVDTLGVTRHPIRYNFTAIGSSGSLVPVSWDGYLGCGYILHRVSPGRGFDLFHDCERGRVAGLTKIEAEIVGGRSNRAAGGLHAIVFYNPANGIESP